MKESKHAQPGMIFVCTESKCARNKSGKLCDRLKALVKESGLKKEIRVVETGCMGHCGEGPNVMIGDQLFHDVRPKDAEEILKGLKTKV